MLLFGLFLFIACMGYFVGFWAGVEAEKSRVYDEDEEGDGYDG